MLSTTHPRVLARRKTFGDEALEIMRPTMGEEDFSAFQQKAPGTFFRVGADNEERGIVYPHHHPLFTGDEDAFSYGINTSVNAACKLLGGNEAV